MTNFVIPKHVGYIIDGNRRWAKQHGLPTYEGYLAGYNVVQDIITATFNAGVKFVSIYVFSTENWKRSQDEVNRVLSLMLQLLTADLPILGKNNIKLRVLGSRENVDERVLKAIDNAEARTANNTVGTLALCFNYGGQQEIVDAVKEIIGAGLSDSDITTDLINQHLYASDIPQIDLVVRTSGEQRLSNFMLWRIAYSEMIFIDKMWPDMTKTDVADIIEEYTKRVRRFGG